MNSNSLHTYFFRLFVWKYPSTSRNANIGSAKRPMHVSQSFPEMTVPQRWSQSMNAIAKMCSDADVVSNLNPVIYSFYCIFLNLQDFCLFSGFIRCASFTESINVYS